MVSLGKEGRKGRRASRGVSEERRGEKKAGKKGRKQECGNGFWKNVLDGEGLPRNIFNQLHVHNSTIFESITSRPSKKKACSKSQLHYYP